MVQDVSYIVKDCAGRRSKLSILQGVSGYFNPGEMAAIMGPSGSGDSPFTALYMVGLPSAFTQAGDTFHRCTCTPCTAGYINVRKRRSLKSGPVHAILSKAMHANAMQESPPFWIYWPGGRLWVSKGVTSCSQERAQPKASSSATQVRCHPYPWDIP